MDIVNTTLSTQCCKFAGSALEILASVLQVCSKMSSRPAPLSAKFKESFAYDTVKERLPVILTKTIDTIHKSISVYHKKYGEVGADDVKTVIGQLSKLRSEMMTDKPIVEIDDSIGDAEKWNLALEGLRQEQSQNPSHFKSPWLFVECAMYRRIASALQTSTYMKDFDPFSLQKTEALDKSIPGAIIMAEFLQKCGDENKDSSGFTKHFQTFLKASLWSNRFDLSLSAGVNHDPGSHDPVTTIKNLEQYILADDSEQILKCLLDARKSNVNNVRVDIVLDNAGFELLSDLFLAEYLLQSKLANTINFHAKNIPWFISDVTAIDLDFTLQKLCTSDDSSLSHFGKKWQSRFKDGSFTMVSKELSEYWTLPMPYTEMLQQDKKLYEYLADADLIIFKGDLNFRKLVADLSWRHETPFTEALESFHPAPICALRTLKADVVVGLQPGKAVEAENRYKDWMVSGKYATILFDS